MPARTTLLCVLHSHMPTETCAVCVSRQQQQKQQRGEQQVCHVCSAVTAPSKAETMLGHYLTGLRGAQAVLKLAVLLLLPQQHKAAVLLRKLV
jgi:hypothetical protein